MRITANFVFFLATNEKPSQWYPARFDINGMHFLCAEQYMMFKKAEVFGDPEKMMDILHLPLPPGCPTAFPDTHEVIWMPKHWETWKAMPQMCKQLGRMVKGFDVTRWATLCEDIVYEANRAKFTQNEDLYRWLLSTHGKTLVEAADYDPIWGVGMREDDDRILEPANWQGENKLGKILTRLRDDLIAEKATS